MKTPLNCLPPLFHILSSTQCFFAGTLIWYHTHNTHTKTQHTQGSVGWYIHINKYLHQLLCAHSSYLYYNEWIIHCYRKFSFHNVFSVQKFFTCQSYLWWLDAIRLGSSCETQIIIIVITPGREGVHLCVSDLTVVIKWFTLNK